MDEEAAGLLCQALALWRGPAFCGLPSPWLRRLGETVDDEMWNARLDAVEVGLRQGRHARLLGELGIWASERPLDERLTGQLMLAACRHGQPAAALDHYHRLRWRLADELGVDPGASLQDLYQQILRNGPAVAASAVISRPPPRPVPSNFPTMYAASLAARRSSRGCEPSSPPGQPGPAARS